MKFKNSRWTMVMVGVIALLMVGTMVWASPPAGVPSAPLLVPIDAQNADRVDNHHAGPSNGTVAQRKNRVLWAGSNGKLSGKVLPWSQLNKRYLNDDRKETISAAVNNGTLLTVDNKGVGGCGLKAAGNDSGVYGRSGSGTGVNGFSVTGRGVDAYSYSGLPLYAGGDFGTNLIEAWDIGASPDNLRFKVVRTSGKVYADGSYNTPASDFAEMMATSEGVTYEPGDLLIIGPNGKPLPSSAPNATDLLGVYSTNPGFVGGVGDDGDTAGKIPVAITGIVPVKASAENGAILPGDLLTSSSIPGHAMKASPVTIDGTALYLPGTILGKALEPLEEGRGVILVLVTLQ